MSEAPLVVLPLPGADLLADRLVAAIPGARRASLEHRRFPDGESYLRVEGDLRGASAVLAANLHFPDPQALALLSLADYARECGARSVGLVAPYLPYMRQDTRFRPGEAITSRSFARFISGSCDWLVTVDPHLHRYPTLAALYTIPAQVVPAAPVMAAWIAQNVARPFVVGPDEESAQWAAEVARLAKCPHAVLTKTRRGDRDVEVHLPDSLAAAADAVPVLIDDIISSGRTMAVAVASLRARGLPAPVCVGVHALFGGDAESVLREAGVTKIITCNTVPHGSNGIDVLPALAAAVIAQVAAVDVS